MKYHFAILTALLSSLVGAQQGFYFDQLASKFQDKNLKDQAAQHATISKEIHRIFNAKKEGERLLNKKEIEYAAAFRKEMNLSPTQNIMIDVAGYALKHQDSVNVKLIDQDDLLFQQFKIFDKSFKVQDYDVKKLSKKDQTLYNDFYKQLTDTINSGYQKYYATKSILRNSKYKKKFLNSEISNRYPNVENCDTSSEFNAEWKCFSTALKNEIQNVYSIPDFMFSENGTYRTRTFFMIDANGKVKAIENSNSSGSYFFDMLGMDITNKLFYNKTLSVSVPYLAEIPLTFVIE